MLWERTPPGVTSSDPVFSTRRRLRSALTATGLSVLLVACGSSDSGRADVDVELGSGITAVTSTSAPASEPTTTTAPPTVGAPDPHTAAATLYMAWAAGDRSVAASVAETAAIDDIWTTAPGEYSLYNRCSTGEFGGSQCLYRGPGGTIQFSMDEVDGSWVVRRAIFSPA